MTRADIINEMHEMVEELSEVAQNDDLEAQFTAAMEAFIADPQSLEIRIEPKNSLPFISFVGLAAAPSALVDALGVTIVANQLSE